MENSLELHLQYWGQNVFQVPFENKGEESSSTFVDSGILCSLGLTGWGKWMGASNTWFPATFPASPQVKLQSLHSRVIISLQRSYHQSPETVLFWAEEWWDKKKKKKKKVTCNWEQVRKQALINCLWVRMREWAAHANVLGKGEWLKANQCRQPQTLRIPFDFLVVPTGHAFRDVRQEGKEEAVMFLAFCRDSGISEADLQKDEKQNLASAAWGVSIY